MRRLFATCLLAALAAGCASVPAPAPVSARAPREPAPLVLVSLDGFRADFLDLGLTPNLSRLAREGVRARWMTPSYPSLTFPNHYTLVTGLRPDHHGIVQNTMRDPVLGDFALKNREAVSDARWWSGEPLWVGVEKAGLRSATMFWPGSEAAIGGVRPWQWRAFDATVPEAERVDTVLGWLGAPAAERPRLVTLYFDRLDHAEHDSGPDSPEAREAIATLDAAIGRLVGGLQARGQLDAVNLVLVSDHGMAPVPEGHAVAVEDMVDPADAEVVTTGQVVGFAPRPGHEAGALRQLLGRHAHYACWRKGELPARWHYGTHPRIPPVVCQMDVGWDAGTRDALARRNPGMRGSHGFDPQAPEMRALFIAHGPAFRSGVELAPFENVDVYPMLARLVGIPPAPNDGDAATLRPASKPDPKR